MFLKNDLKELLRKWQIYVHRSPPEILSEHLRAVFARLGVNCVIDVGGHYGEYGKFLRRLGYKGHIASFEPTTEAFDKLALQTEKDRNWRAFKYGLGAAEGQIDINIARHSVFNSFLTPTQFSSEQFGKEAEVVARETVRIETFDRMLQQCVEEILDPVIYLKLDTQGYDLEVLRGAQQNIDRVVALQSEVSVKSIYVGMPGFREAIDRYLEHGFEITGLFPVTRDTNLCVIEFDCVMRRITN